MKTCCVRYSLTIVVLIVWLVSSCTKKPSEPQLVPDLLGKAIYVAPSGTGNGSPDSPMGSIQRAIDSAFTREPKLTVLISIGVYNEQIGFREGVDVSGARDRSNAWRITNSDSTVIVGPVTDSVCVTAICRNIQTPTLVDRLDLLGPNAQAPGVSSIGLLVIGCDSMTIQSCTIRGGHGAVGDVGAPGENGDSSAKGSSGGAGGEGGSCPPPSTGKAGLPGNCFPDSLFSGMGGDGGYRGAPPSDGQNGQAGTQGTDGTLVTPTVALVKLNAMFTVVTASGSDGADGTWGCGGGGGGGWDSHLTPATERCAEGWPGAPGGSGGQGGRGGKGGKGGGSSIGILCSASSLILLGSNIGGTMAGNGGTAGIGGQGAPGDSGYVGVYNFGNGGDGGDGGNGGSGGGGMGGCAFAIALYRSAVDYDSTTTLSTGVPGAGGGPSTSHGPWGLNLRTYVFDSISTVIPMRSVSGSKQQ